MERTRSSLIFLAGFLIVLGLGLFLAPDLVLRMLLSNSDYGAIMPRFAGVFIVGMGIQITQAVRYRTEILYPTPIWIRIFVCFSLIGLYFMSQDPAFLVILLLTAIGLLVSIASYWVDCQSGLQHEQLS